MFFHALPLDLLLATPASAGTQTGSLENSKQKSDPSRSSLDCFTLSEPIRLLQGFRPAYSGLKLLFGPALPSFNDISLDQPICISDWSRNDPRPLKNRLEGNTPAVLATTFSFLPPRYEALVQQGLKGHSTTATGELMRLYLEGDPQESGLAEIALKRLFSEKPLFLYSFCQELISWARRRPGVPIPEQVLHLLREQDPTVLLATASKDLRSFHTIALLAERFGNEKAREHFASLQLAIDASELNAYLADPKNNLEVIQWIVRAAQRGNPSATQLVREMDLQIVKKRLHTLAQSRLPSQFPERMGLGSILGGICEWRSDAVLILFELREAGSREARKEIELLLPLLKTDALEQEVPHSWKALTTLMVLQRDFKNRYAAESLARIDYEAYLPKLKNPQHADNRLLLEALIHLANSTPPDTNALKALQNALDEKTYQKLVSKAEADPVYFALLVNLGLNPTFKPRVHRSFENLKTQSLAKAANWAEENPIFITQVLYHAIEHRFPSLSPLCSTIDLEKLSRHPESSKDPTLLARAFAVLALANPDSSEPFKRLKDLSRTNPTAIEAMEFLAHPTHPSVVRERAKAYLSSVKPNELPRAIDNVRWLDLLMITGISFNNPQSQELLKESLSRVTKFDEIPSRFWLYLEGECRERISSWDSLPGSNRHEILMEIFHSHPWQEAQGGGFFSKEAIDSVFQKHNSRIQKFFLDQTLREQWEAPIRSPKGH